MRVRGELHQKSKHYSFIAVLYRIVVYDYQGKYATLITFFLMTTMATLVWLSPNGIKPYYIQNSKLIQTGIDKWVKSQKFFVRGDRLGVLQQPAQSITTRKNSSASLSGCGVFPGSAAHPRASTRPAISHPAPPGADSHSHHSSMVKHLAHSAVAKRCAACPPVS